MIELHEFEFEPVDENDLSKGYELSYFSEDEPPAGKFNMQAATLKINDDPDLYRYALKRVIPAKWEICDTCRGNGKHDHPAFSNGITESDRDDMGEDAFHDYLAGRYDVKCQPCKGTGKVHAPDLEYMTEDERKEYNTILEDKAAHARERDYERRMGC